MKYYHEVLDPRPQARAEVLKLLASRSVLGIEVTIPELAAACCGNIDPQHTNGNPDRAAIEEALTLDPLPSPGFTLATVRADLDSIGAMAVLELRANGNDLSDDAIDRIDRIAQLDKFAFGSWRPRSLAEGDIDWELRGLAALISDFRRPLTERVELKIDWLVSGLCAGLDMAVESARAAWRAARASSQVEVADGIAVVVSTHRFAMDIGYALAPIVVASNPAMRLGGEPHLKHTVAVWPGSGALDVAGVLADLLAIEPGWGNVAGGVVGSPQGVASQLSTDEVLAVVRRHLRLR